MEEDDYHLKWAKHHDAFVSVFNDLYSKEILVDCTLAAEEKYIKAHRIVLMACSPYLQEILCQYSADYPIVFLDMKFSQLEAIVNFCYHGEVTVAHNELDDFIQAAKMLKIKGLTNKDFEDFRAKGLDDSVSVGEISETADVEMAENQENGDGEENGVASFHHLAYVKNVVTKLEAEGSDNSDVESDVSSIGAEDLENMDVSGFEQTAQTGGNIIFPWTCTRCGEAFPTRGLHDVHRKACVIHKDLPWKCQQCPNTYKNKKDLVRHLMYCGKETPRLYCNRCGSSYKYGRGLKRHLKYCGKEIQPIKCPDCDKSFKYTRGLRRHQRRCGIMEALAKLAEKGVTPVLIRKKAPWNESPLTSKDKVSNKPSEKITGSPVLQTHPPLKKIHTEVKEPPEGEQTPLSTPSICACGKVYKYKRAFQRHMEICPDVKNNTFKEDSQTTNSSQISKEAARSPAAKDEINDNNLRTEEEMQITSEKIHTFKEREQEKQKGDNQDEEDHREDTLAEEDDQEEEPLAKST